MFNIPNFGKKIRAERELRGLTLDQLQEKLNISRQTLSKWEKGQGAGPTVFDLLNMCELFDCDMGYLVGEYPCRHKESSDIHANTGLSEIAIENLSEIKGKERTIMGSSKLMLINAILEDDSFLDNAAGTLYALEMIPEKAIYTISFLDKKESSTISSMISNDSDDLRRLYMADLQNIIFDFIKCQFQ